MNVYFSYFNFLLSLPFEEVGLRGFGGVLLLSVLGPFDGEDEVIVTVSVHRIDSALSVVAMVEIDERKSTRFVCSSIATLSSVNTVLELIFYPNEF